MSLKQRLMRVRRALGGDLDARLLGPTRALVGAAAFLRGLEAARILDRVLAPGHLRLPYVPGVVAPPARLVPALTAVWCLAALLFAFGRFPRASGSLLVVVMLYVLAIDQQTYSNHLYLLCWIVSLLLLALFGQRPRAGAGAATVPAWPAFLLKTQLTVVYLFSAVSKLSPPFLSGALLSLTLRRGGPLAVPEAWHRPSVLAPIAVASVLLELYLAAGFWLRRRRRLLATLGVSFHLLSIAVLDPAELVQLVVFTLEMLALYCVFFIDSPPRPETAP